MMGGPGAPFAASTAGLAAVDHGLVAAITVLLPIHDLLFWYPRLLRAEPARLPRVRSRAYLESTIIEWGLVAAVVAWWGFRGRSFGELGLAAPAGWGFWAVLAVALGISVLLVWQRLSLTRSSDPEVRSAVLSHLDNLRPLLPHTRGELRRFSVVSVTAGICEEALFRGFLLWYLSRLVPLVPALLIGAVLFGMAHAYQGTKGVLQTAAVGAGLVLLYLGSGSLWIPMVVHAFVDLNSGILAYMFLRTPDPQGS